MLAAVIPQQPSLDGIVSRPRPPVARSVFAAAYQELCARIWIELEFTAEAARRVPANATPDDREDPVMTAAILRLELLVLVDACRSARWRNSLLTAAQCDSMCSMLTDVLAALYVDSECLSEALAEAQDRVLDEILAGSGDTDAAASGACACKIARSSSMGGRLFGMDPR